MKQTAESQTHNTLRKKASGFSKSGISVVVGAVVMCALLLGVFSHYNPDAQLHAQEQTAEENSALTPAPHSAYPIPSYARVFSTIASFEDAKDDLLGAIAENGLVVSSTSHVKDMLENTAAVAGVTKPVYQEAEIILFCKAGLSHDLVAGNPHNLVLCPYSIAIYVIADEPERVYLSYREPQASDENIRALTKPIEDLLVKIIEEVI